MGLFSTFWALQGYFFWPVGAIFGVEVRLKNIFGTYKCRLSIFVLEVWPYLFVLHSAKFWAFFLFLSPSGLFFFWPVGAIFGVEVRLKNIFGIYKCRLSIFVLEVQPYLFVSHLTKFWAFFCTFWALRGYFGGWDQVQKLFES